MDINFVKNVINGVNLATNVKNEFSLYLITIN